MEITSKLLEQDLNRFFVGRESSSTFSDYCDISAYIRKNWDPIFAHSYNKDASKFNSRVNRDSNQNIYLMYNGRTFAYITFSRSRTGVKDWRNSYKYTIKNITVEFVGDDLKKRLDAIDTEITEIIARDAKIKELAPQVYKELLSKYNDRQLVLDILKEIRDHYWKY